MHMPDILIFLLLMAPKSIPLVPCIKIFPSSLTNRQQFIYMLVSSSTSLSAKGGRGKKSPKEIMEKWQGQVSSTLDQTVKPDQAWSLLGDFSSLDKFLPLLATCQLVEGTNGVPGCVRYCANAPDPSGLVLWAKEKLVAIDPIERRYEYEVIENNMGFGLYLATLGVVKDDEGCAKIEWSFECEPIVGLAKHDFLGYMESGVKEMAKRVGDAVSSSANGEEK